MRLHCQEDLFSIFDTLCLTEAFYEGGVAPYIQLQAQLLCFFHACLGLSCIIILLGGVHRHHANCHVLMRGLKGTSDLKQPDPLISKGTLLFAVLKDNKFACRVPERALMPCHSTM